MEIWDGNVLLRIYSTHCYGCTRGFFTIIDVFTHRGVGCMHSCSAREENK
jgi:hypothetical protein